MLAEGTKYNEMFKALVLGQYKSTNYVNTEWNRYLRNIQLICVRLTSTASFTFKLIKKISGMRKTISPFWAYYSSSAVISYGQIGMCPEKQDVQTFGDQIEHSYH